MILHKKNNYSKLIIGIVVLIFFIYFFFHFTQVSNIPKTLSSLHPSILIALLILEFLFIINRGQIYQYLYKKMQIILSIHETTELFCVSYTLNILTPTAGVAGIAFFTSQAARHKTSKTKVILINLLFYFASYISIATLLIFSCLYFLVTKNINIYLLNTVEIILFILLILSFIIYLCCKNQHILNSILNFSVRLINKFLKIIHVRSITAEQIARIHDEITYFKLRFQKDKSIFWKPLALFILGNFYEVVTIYLIIIGLGGNIGILPLIVCYSISLLFMLASFTPSGIGIVEPIMTVILTSFGVPLEIAGLTTLIFRAFSFWLPLPFGLIFIKKYL